MYKGTPDSDPASCDYITLQSAGVNGTGGQTLQGGTVTINNNGTANPADDFIDYNPKPGYTGVDQFKYVIVDKYGVTSTATVILNSLNESCGDGVDNDGDGLIDCADLDCKPTITNVTTIQPTCANKTGGQITISATGSSALSYSIKNQAVWQTSNVFTNLGVGQYTIQVKDTTGCITVHTSPVIFDMATCIEICNDGIDNDGDGFIDCDDPDCVDVGNATTINNN